MWSFRGKQRRVSGILVTIGAIALVTGCASTPAETPQEPVTEPTSSSDWDAIVAAAEQEGQLQVWAELGTGVAEAVQEAFKQDYPEIEITVTSILPPNLTQRVDAEQAADQATVDVVLQTNRGWRDAHAKDDYFAPIVGPDIVAADEQLRDGAAPVTSGAPIPTQVLYNDNKSVAAFFGPYGYAWNSEALDSPPESFESLFADDTYRDRIGMNAPDASATTTGLYVLISERYPDVFTQLGELNPTYFPNGSSLVQAMTAGAVDVAFTLNPSIAGENTGFAFDDEFPIPATAVFGEIISAAPNPNAAQLFANWLATAGASAVLDEQTFIPIAPVSDGDLSITDVEIYEEPPADEVKAAQDRINADLGR